MRSTRGFTLIEIIVAVALVAILSAAIAPNVLNNIAQGRLTRAKSDVQSIAQAIQMFKNDVGAYPNRAQPGDGNDPTPIFQFLASRGPIAPTDVGSSDEYWPTNATSSSPMLSA